MWMALTNLSVLSAHHIAQINGHATQDEAQKDWHDQPVAAPHQQVVFANYKHAGFRFRRACSIFSLRGCVECGTGVLHATLERSCH